MFLRSVFAFFLVLMTFDATRVVAESVETSQRAVLVTGASTGIGRTMAETLAANGYFVYAGARKDNDIKALSAIDNVMGVRLDVTRKEDIEAAVKTVAEGGRGLYGLVNNAGIFLGGPLIEVAEDDVDWLFEVNVLGPLRVTQAFAPMIIESKGRITTTGSISGILSGTFSGPYSMSKHAIEAYTDSLAVEMARFGVQVSVIEPGNYDSKIASTAVKRMSNTLALSDSLYKEELQGLLAIGDRSNYKAPDEVAEALLHAMGDKSPYRRYMVVPNEGEAQRTIAKAIQELVELNQYQAYSYSRDQLVEMLDAALAK